MSSSAQKLVSASIIYAFGDFLVVGVSAFLLLPVYLRFMTPAEYGLYGSLTVLMKVLSIILMIGMHSAITRFYFIYRKSGKERAYLASIWMFQSLLALSLCLLLGLLGRPLWRWLSPSIAYNPYIWIVLVGAMLSFSSGIYSIWLRVQEKPRPFVVLQLVNTAVLIIFMIVFLVFMRGGALGAFTAVLGTKLVIAVVGFALLGSKLKWKIDLKYLKKSLRFGGWMMLGALGYYLLNRSQILVLQHFSDLAMVGVFNVGVQLSGVVTLVSISFTKAWQPFIYSVQTKKEASIAIARISKFFIAGMIYLALVLNVLSREILKVLARPLYADAALVLRLTVIAAFFYVLSTLPTTALLYEKRADLMQIIILSFAAINLALTIKIVPIWEMMGAAWVMVFTSVLATVVSFIVAHKIMPVNYDWGIIVKIFVLGTLVLLLEGIGRIFIVVPYITIFRVIILMAFPLGLFLIGIFTKQEILSFRTLILEKMRLFRFNSKS